MTILIELPHLEEGLDRAFQAVDTTDCWDGFALDECLLEAIEPWEDRIDLTRTPWHWLNPCLPDEISSRLTQMDKATREKFHDHIRLLMRRASSQDLRWTTIDLAVDRLAWPENSGNGAQLMTEMQQLTTILKEFRLIVGELIDGICLSLRLPLPSKAQKAQDLALQLMQACGNDKCKLFLNIMVDELRTQEPDEVLGPYMRYLQGIRLRYEPRLGVRASLKMQRDWAEYLRENDYQGAVIFSPKLKQLVEFENELNRLSDEVTQCWPKACAVPDTTSMGNKETD